MTEAGSLVNSKAIAVSIGRCAESLFDLDRLCSETEALKSHPGQLATFAGALFELECAKRGDAHARANLSDTADCLLTFWRDKSGEALAATHPTLEQLWNDASQLLVSFEHKRLERVLEACWQARHDAVELQGGDAAAHPGRRSPRRVRHLPLSPRAGAHVRRPLAPRVRPPHRAGPRGVPRARCRRGAGRRRRRPAAPVAGPRPLPRRVLRGPGAGGGRGPPPRRDRPHAAGGAAARAHRPRPPRARGSRGAAAVLLRRPSTRRRPPRRPRSSRPRRCSPRTRRPRSTRPRFIEADDSTPPPLAPPPPPRTQSQEAELDFIELEEVLRRCRRRSAAATSTC